MTPRAWGWPRACAGSARAAARAVWLVGLACLGLALLAQEAHAHKPSDSYLSLRVEGATATGRWDIALRDLDNALVLDTNGDGQITWGEVRTRHDDIARLALDHLAVGADGQDCSLSVGAQQIDGHTDGAYSVLPLSVRCPRPVATLSLRYTLFAELDPQHRGLLALTDGNAEPAATRTVVLGPDQPLQSFELGSAASTSAWRTLADYLREGVWHIWIGFDHVLFLLALLLPAVGFWRRLGGGPARWQPVARFREAFVDVLGVVTAFTLAHSITLSLAALGLVSLPSRLVESVIAASVVLAALNNLRQHARLPRAATRIGIAFGFGLLHGFGFASVLADLGLPQGALALALLGFNLGVELGQLAIVAAFLPLAHALRHTAFYRTGVLRLGSLAIAVLAGLWLVERAFGLALMPF